MNPGRAFVTERNEVEMTVYVDDLRLPASTKRGAQP
jgi:hypothetical protein